MSRTRTLPLASITSLALAALLLLFAAGTAVAQEPGMPQLSAEHKLLQKDVGTWDAVVKIWPIPNAPQPIESRGVEKNELLPGGMWLLSRFDGDMGGTKFSGAGTFGYDPVEKKYIGTWVDSMTPHLMTTKADHDPDTGLITGTAEGRDPTTGQITTYKQISRYNDDGTRTFEMYATDPDGKEFKMMEITYTRRAQ